ncbi:hypothetical protein [Rossellomorea yichunensis]|jgi:hypothetical protein|uniref:hypothetical protein n=1 Tax=Rossellomorea yichunensis TaxID=3077331 RepID=UPI0028DF8625|nr:hypothetical protein [Rossellomorea sp. YC4-1]MDT9023428.1 hypothetical protein [Rossellomorea sp. YC4-1]
MSVNDDLKKQLENLDISGIMNLAETMVNEKEMKQTKGNTNEIEGNKLIKEETLSSLNKSLKNLVNPTSLSFLSNIGKLSDVHQSSIGTSSLLKSIGSLENELVNTQQKLDELKKQNTKILRLLKANTE